MSGHWTSCRFCDATGRRGCISCGSGAVASPRPATVMSADAPASGADGLEALKEGLGPDAIERARDEDGIVNIHSLLHGLDSAMAKRDGRPAPERPVATATPDEALVAPIDEALVTDDVVSMVMLEIADSPVVPEPGQSIADAVRTEPLPDGTYRLMRDGYPEPIPASDIQRMRARYLVGNQAFVKATGRMPVIPNER